MDVEIHVDRIRCIGSGECVHVARGVFDQDDDGISVVVDPRGEPEETIVRAVVACRMRAITLRVGGSAVGAEELRGWAHGAHTTDPVVSLLEQFCDEHQELRTALAELPSDDDVDHARVIGELTRAHMRSEERAYSVLTALVDPTLVGVFEDDHGLIERALDAVATDRSASTSPARALGDFVEVVEDHIRLEETVLFPVALAALARRGSEAPVTTP